MEYREALDWLLDCRLVAILRGIPPEKTLAVTDALVHGGVRALEFTFEHGEAGCEERTCRQVRQVTDAYGDELLVGCGTVLSAHEVRMAYKAGARLIVSPNTDPEIIALTRDLGMISMPGAMTPTEIVAAHKAGASVVKLFPAGLLGGEYIRAVLAPLRHIPISAVGGVNPDEAEGLLDAGVCGFGLSSSIIRAQWVKDGDMAAITARAREYVSAIERWKEKNA